MNGEAVRQRIKFLIEHGEVYPQEKRSSDLSGKLLMVVILLQLVSIAMRAVGWH